MAHWLIIPLIFAMTLGGSPLRAAAQTDDTDEVDWEAMAAEEEIFVSRSYITEDNSTSTFFNEQLLGVFVTGSVFESSAFTESFFDTTSDLVLEGLVETLEQDGLEPSQPERSSIGLIGDQRAGWLVTAQLPDLPSSIGTMQFGVVIVRQGAWMQVLTGNSLTLNPVAELAALAEEMENRWPNSDPVTLNDDDIRVGGPWAMVPVPADLQAGLVLDEALEQGPEVTADAGPAAEDEEEPADPASDDEQADEPAETDEAEATPTEPGTEDEQAEEPVETDEQEATPTEPAAEDEATPTEPAAEDEQADEPTETEEPEDTTADPDADDQQVDPPARPEEVTPEDDPEEPVTTPSDDEEDEATGQSTPDEMPDDAPGDEGDIAVEETPVELPSRIAGDFDAAIWVILTPGTYRTASDGGCAGTGPAELLRSGSSLTLFDSNGAEALVETMIEADGTVGYDTVLQRDVCVFQLTFEDVPARAQYFLDADRTVLGRFTYEELSSGELELVIGE